MAEPAGELAAKLLLFALNVARNPQYAATHPRETKAAKDAAVQLLAARPDLKGLPQLEAAKQIQGIATTQGTSEAQVVANMSPGVRDMYNQLMRNDPKQARAFLIQEMMASLKLMEKSSQTFRRPDRKSA